MNNKLLIAAITAALAGTMNVYAADKVEVCHEGKTLSIAKAALAAHLAHGDTEGACATAPTEEPTAEDPAIEEPVAEEPATEEPVAEEPTTEEPVVEEPTTEEPVAEEPATEEPVTEEPPPVDDNVIAPPPITPEQELANLLASAEELTVSTFSGGTVLMPEVQVEIFGNVVAFAVVLELIPQADGGMAFNLLGVKDVEAREGVTAATYSLGEGILVIPEIKVETLPGEFVSFYATLKAISFEPLQLALDLENTYPITEEPAVEEPAAEEPAAEEPAAEEPAAEEPAVEEPAAEEPAVEEPAAEEPAVEEPAAEEPAVEEPAAEEPAVEEPAAEEPAVEEPAAEEPAVEEPAAEEPVPEPVRADPLPPTEQI